MDHAHEHGVSLSLERVVFFSDAVFAIAITLLVLEIKVPELEFGSPDHEYWLALGNLWPKFFAFVLSFLVIGRLWMSHHQIFSRATGYHPRLMWPNTLLLLLIAFMPFATAFLGDNLGTFVPALLYNLTLAVIGLLTVWLAQVMLKLGIARPPRPGEGGGSIAVSLAALVSIAIAWFIPQFSQFGMLTIPLWMRLLRGKAEKAG